METDENCFKVCSEVKMPAGPDENQNDGARVSDKALDEDGDDSDAVTILPFRGIQKLVKCRICHTYVYSGTELPCSVRDCEAAYHLECAQKSLRASSSRKFKCPQHACYLCKDKYLLLRCIRCELAWHTKCAAFPEYVTHLRKQPGKAICWRGHEIKEPAVQVNSVEEVFLRLPVPGVTEDFDIDSTWKNTIETEMEPPPYEHIRRNIYLVKKKSDDWVADIGCANCNSSVCSEDCVCRVQCISCSKACCCSGMCTNRPFRKEKRIKVVKTELCGWGVEAAEPIDKGDLIIEYVGEVIDDDSCKERLSDMKYMGAQNFYMCEVQRDFTIDSTFKGNTARFLNHSCDPNCNLEKCRRQVHEKLENVTLLILDEVAKPWQVDGETRVGVFAARAIQEGEPLTYDYRYIQFGPEVKCLCGTSNCRGYLGARRKPPKVEELSRDWGSKGRRAANRRRR